MTNPKHVKESAAAYTALSTDLSQPVIVERDGRPVAAVISIEEYERYRALLNDLQFISAREARRIADRVVFGELVGLALSSGEPEWVPEPEPVWRVPYRTFDGHLLTTVDVNARSQAVSLTEERRNALLQEVGRLTTASHASQ